MEGKIQHKTSPDAKRLDPGWPAVLAVIDSIPDTPTCGGEQPNVLFHLSRDTQGRGAIVEIGSFAGCSTIALAYGQKVKEGAPIYAVDCNFRQDIEDNLKHAGVYDWVRLMRGRSSQLIRTWKKPIELLFIDGDHSFLGCRNDIRCWAPHVIVGGAILFHDYGNWGYEGVHLAVQKHLIAKVREWKCVSDREVGSLYELRRIAKARDVPKLTLRRRLGEARDSFIWILGELGISYFARPMQGGMRGRK